MVTVFKPLGWDWEVSVAVIAGFPAREIIWILFMPLAMKPMNKLWQSD